MELDEKEVKMITKLLNGMKGDLVGKRKKCQDELKYFKSDGIEVNKPNYSQLFTISELNYLIESSKSKIKNFEDRIFDLNQQIIEIETLTDKLQTRP